jgi:hypothetical protein
LATTSAQVKVTSHIAYYLDSEMFDLWPERQKPGILMPEQLPKASLFSSKGWGQLRSPAAEVALLMLIEKVPSCDHWSD